MQEAALPSQSLNEDFSEDFDDGQHKLAMKKAEQAEKERKTLAKRETTAVAWLQYFTLAVIIITALVVCLGVYFYTRNDEQHDFEHVFESSAVRVISSFHDSVARILVGVDALAVGITSHAVATGATFPMVHIPDWPLRGATTRILTKSVASNFFPLITDETRAEWEAYVTKKVTQEKVQKKAFKEDSQYIARQDKMFGLETLEFKPPTEGSPLAGRNFSTELSMLKGGVQPNGTGPYLAFYHTSPVLPAPALPNLNILTFPPLAAGVKHVLETKLAYLSNAVNPSAMFHMFLARGQFRHDQETFLSDAVTPFIYPVFNNFSPERSLVGVCLANIYWRLHFENILPENARGIIAVLSNSVNQTFTYQLDGAAVAFLGKGDLHDTRYDKYEISADISDYLKSQASVQTQAYTAVPLTETGVQYSLSLYPSKELEDQYLSNDPVTFAVVVATVFLFTSMVFLAYNFMVERRQKVVLDRAVKSAAVVGNLFPEEVKEQLINDSVAKKTKSNTWQAKDGDLNNRQNPALKTIASKYPEVTIMFADIAGFTSWSSERDPEAVFELLGTLYAAFDALAAKRDVFKVETIGDCYLAVTGLPSPQPDHALRMCKFARDCMQKVKLLTASLADSLGHDTLNLSFRVGLHSGSVTAGVIRGDKSRFQLFGDTVNTAARMESNGVKSKIHVSKQTAQQLIQHGREDILIEREEKIFAKGKGHLQTFFLSDEFTTSISETATFTTMSISGSSGNLNLLGYEDKPPQECAFKSSDETVDDMPYAATSAQGGEDEEVLITRDDIWT